MRTLTRLVLGVLVVVGMTAGLSAQAAPDQQAAPPAEQPQTPPQTPTPQPPAETPAPTPTEQTPQVTTPSPVATPSQTQQAEPEESDDAGRFFLNVSIGGQSREQVFNDTSTFDIYGEKGALATAQSIGGGTLFDVSAGMRVWKTLGVGIAYSTLKNKNDAAVSVRVPHPVVFGQSRTATATVAALEHSENVIHLQFMWMIPLTNKFQLTAMAGPSFFTVRQTIASVQAPQDIEDPPPFTNVRIRTVSVTDVKDSPVGINVGVDVTYFITRIKGVGIGVGAFARHASADLELVTPPGVTRDNTDLKAGGPQGGVGLRLQF